MKINRILTQNIKKAIKPGKVVLIYGPRRAGKTTLINKILKNFKPDLYLKVDGDQIRYHDILSSRDAQKLKLFIGNKKFLIIDEAQRIEDIGLNLKIIVDNFPYISVLASGSASLDLAAKTSEFLTGRKRTFLL